MITFNNKVVTYNHKWINGDGSPSPITSYNYQVDWIWNLPESHNGETVYYTSQQFNQTPFSTHTNFPGYAYIYIPYYDEWYEQGAHDFSGNIYGYYNSSQYEGNSLMKFVYKWPLDTPSNRRYISINFTNVSSSIDIPANQFTMRITDLNTSQVITSWNNPLIERDRTAQCFIRLSDYE